MLMVQSNAQPMRPTKLKGPPPVPPRPNQSVVAEALAKTRKAVAESKDLTKPRTPPKQEHARSKTLDRSTQPSVSPKLNGLARVKSFIRDVISDKSPSSDGKKSSGQSSRRSSNDSCSVLGQSPVKKSTESLNSKAVKTCKQILSRSLSTSNKLEQDGKFKVAKSSSFVEKTMPLRKAPPPPLSPKPKTKLKPIRPLPTPTNSNSLERRRLRPPTPVESPYCSPVDARPSKSPPPEAPYATVQEVQDFDDRLRNSPPLQINDLPDKQTETVTVPDASTNEETLKENNDSLEIKTSRVIETLISEIMASVNFNKDEANSVIDKGKSSENIATGHCSSDMEKMKDMSNHEMLIYELQSMRSQSNVSETGKPCDKSTPEDVETVEFDSEEESEAYYAVAAVSEAEDDFSEHSCAYLPDDDLKTRLRKQYKAMSSDDGLPPLPQCLRDLVEAESSPESEESSPSEEQATAEEPPTDLNSQLKYLKKEMKSLRQMDLALLSELWTLNESIASWRRQLERAPQLERVPRRPAPPPPPPPPPDHPPS